ncbi:helix-turn-helix domain-containing protein [Streptomyces sp. NPDC017529]|uniref:helix-turn-helix domain-containing protein n=1 Tax=Streptomyces sp. NPDC017529 TaxID=3365000 RepID=UPI0037921AB7
MPRWRALPEELDPQVKEFASQLRRLVERSGLSVAAVADRTGYSKTSWERYLNGRLLPPQRAVVALAEATGAHAGHLTTMWELAERAWSRSEMRHDVTMEAIRVAQARAALGEFGPAPDKAKSRTKEKAKERGKDKSQDRKPDQGRGDELPSSADFPGLTVPPKPSPAPSAPPAPPAPPAMPPPEPAAGAAAPPADGNGTDRPDRAAWPRMADYGGADPAGQAPRYDTPRAEAAGPAAPGPGAAPATDAADRQLRRRRITMFLAGVVGALLVIAAAVLLLDVNAKEGGKQAAPTASASASKKPVLPAGVKCAGADCAGKDPEAMGCGGRNADSTSRGTAGRSLVEVRYSKVCGAAWARVTGAAPGDRASISSAGRTETAKAGQDGDAYTAMVPVTGDPAKITACGTTVTGVKGCTKPVPAGSGRSAGR